MPSGRLAFATRRVDLMAASMRAPLALCTDGMTILPPPHKAWEKVDQMVVRVQGAPDNSTVELSSWSYVPTIPLESMSTLKSQSSDFNFP